MEQYRITSTTDKMHIGKIFTLNEDTQSIDIIEDTHEHHIKYSFIQKKGNVIKINNSNNTIRGTLV